MLLTNTIVRNSISSIIAPHGITDLIHAQQNRLISQLFLINIMSIGTTTILINKSVSDMFFFAISAYHFRNDMPLINLFPKFLISTIILLIFININPLYFVYYMIFLHVPNHYKINLIMMRKQPIYSVSLISIISIISTYIVNSNLILYPITHKIARGIIFSHIIYEELYVHKNKLVNQ